MYRFLSLSLILAFISVFAVDAHAGAIIAADTGGGTVMQTQVNNGEYDHIYDGDVGAEYNTDSGCLVDLFPLPYLDLENNQQVTNATVTYYLEGKNGTPTYNVQLYGLKRVATQDTVNSTSDPVLLSDWYTGTSDSKNTLLDAEFVTPSTAAGQTVSYTGANVAAFVQSQYSNAAFNGMNLSTQRYVFFRLSPNGTQNGFNNYRFGSSRNPNPIEHPTLALTISNGIVAINGRLQFSFNLPEDSTTSAGVYDSTGKLIRTIWNNVRYQAGTNYGVWDGNDDSGTAVAPGTNYQIKLIFHNVQYIFGGMVGNTSASQSGSNVYHAFGKIHDMAIGGNTAFYSVGYNELETPFHQFTVGQPQVPSELNFGYEMTDDTAAIYYVATDGTRSYWAKTYGGIDGSCNTYVIAITNSNNSFYTFPKGTTPTGPNQKYSSCVDFYATTDLTQPPYSTNSTLANGATGLAVQVKGNELFVSHSNLNVVRVFDKVQGNSLGSISLPSPGRMAVTADGDVWVVSNGTTPCVNRYTFANGAATLVQSITTVVAPVAVGVSADDSTVLIADGGSSQQIKAFDNNSGASLWTYGTEGGMAANGPAINTNTFQFAAQRSNYNEFDVESFITFQSDNTFWIADGGNGRVLHFGITGGTPVYIEQIAYTDVSYRATVDATDATRVFNQFLEYSVNYSLPLGGTNGSWKLVNNWGFGLPNDATHLYYGFAQGFNNVVTLPNGRTYGLTQNFITGSNDLFELPPSGPLRYTGYTFNNNPRIYEDGTIRFNITGGNNASLSYYSSPLTGFDNQNNPVWGSPELLASTALSSANGDPIPWVAFTMRSEMTTSGMIIDFDASQADSGYHIAAVPRGGSSFIWRAGPSVNGTSTGWFPQDGHFDTGDGLKTAQGVPQGYAANIAMALGRNIVYGFHGEFWGGGEASQWVNYFDDGLMVGLFGTFESPATLGSNVVNGFAGNSYSPSLVLGADGNTYLYHNDESNHGGTCQWKITGWNGITEISGTGKVGSTVALSPPSANPAPSVELTSPTIGATYDNGTSVLISASVSGNGSDISSVQFFDGSTSLGTVTTAPYSIDPTGLTPGTTHTITAVATDADNVSTTSSVVTITVNSDGQNSPPPAPISLSAGTVTSSSIGLTWTQPAMGTSSSTVGRIMSFQCDKAGDANALSTTAAAGAPSSATGGANYQVTDWNLLGISSTSAITFPTELDDLDKPVANLGVNLQMAGSNDTNSTQDLTGTMSKLFGNVVNTTFNTPIAMSISNIPYASYDVVVYTLPGNIAGANQTASVTVGDGAYTSGKVSLSYNKLPTNYTVQTVPYGTNASMTNINTVVFQGLSGPLVEVQGGNIVGFQIVERPYDQGTPTSYTLQRATGTDGTFANDGNPTVGSPATGPQSYTDSDGISASATYQYRLRASNGVGASAYSNVITVTTPAASSSSSSTSTFASWQAQNLSGITDPNLTGPTADPYGSGIPNLMAYALQLNPATAKPTDVPYPIVVNGHLSITFFVPSSISDINYVVEVSSDLVAWNSGTGYTQTVTSVPSSGGTTVTVQDTLPTTTAKRFMRLRVTEQ